MGKYRVELDDGQMFDVEADSEPSREEVMQALGFGQPQPSMEDTGQSLAASSGNQFLRDMGSIIPNIIGGIGDTSEAYVRNLNPVAWAAKAGIPGAQSLVDIAAKPGEFLSETAADSMLGKLEEMTPTNPLYQDALTQKASGAVGQGVGQLASFLVPAKAFGLAPSVARAVGLGGAFAQGAKSGADTAETYGVEDDLAKAAMTLGFGGIETGSEMLFGLGAKGPTEAIIGALKSAVRPGRTATRAAKTILGEAGEEIIAGQSQDWLTGALVDEDPNRPGFALNGAALPPDTLSMKNLYNRLEEGALGAIGGTVFAGAEALGSRTGVDEALSLRYQANTLLEDLSKKESLTPEEQAQLEQVQAEDANVAAWLERQGFEAVRPALDQVIANPEASEQEREQAIQYASLIDNLQAVESSPDAAPEEVQAAMEAVSNHPLNQRANRFAKPNQNLAIKGTVDERRKALEKQVQEYGEATGVFPKQAEAAPATAAAVADLATSTQETDAEQTQASTASSIAPATAQAAASMGVQPETTAVAEPVDTSVPAQEVTPTTQTDAIQVQEPAKSVLREERPEVELPAVGERDAQEQEAATAGQEAPVAPEALPAPSPEQAEQQYADLTARAQDLRQRRAALEQIPRDRWTKAEEGVNNRLRAQEAEVRTGLDALRATSPELFPVEQKAPTLEERFPTPAPQGTLNRAEVAAAAPMRAEKRQTMPESPAGAADILDWLVDNKIYVPPKDEQGGEVDFLAQDDRISRYYRQFITTRDSASDTADVIADRAVREGLLPAGSTANELGAAIEQAIKERKSTRAQIKREGARMAEAEEQTKRFYRDTAEGAVEVDPNDLVTGDVLIVEDTELKVTKVESDDEGRVLSVTLQDGKRYGVQEVSGEYAILADEFRPKARKAEVEFVPAEELEEPAQEPTAQAESPARSSQKEAPKDIVQTAQDVVNSLIGVIPSAADAWVGTREQLLTDPKVRREFIRIERSLDRTLTKEAASAMFDAFMSDMNRDGATFGGRTYIIADAVEVTKEDGDFEGAIKRILRHEDTHIAIDAITKSNPKLKKEWESLKKRVRATKLDDLAKRRYPEFSDWRDDSDSFDSLVHEYFAEQMEHDEEGRPVDDEDLLQKFIDYMRKVLARIVGRDVSIKEIREFVRAGREARARQLEATPRSSQQDDVFAGMDFAEEETDASQTRFSQKPVTPEQDAAYMDAVERGDMETAQRMVDEAAKKAGFKRKLFTGQPRGLKVIPESTRNELPRGYAFLTNDREVAGHYSGAKTRAGSNTDFGTGRVGKTYRVAVDFKNTLNLDDAINEEWWTEALAESQGWERALARMLYLANDTKLYKLADTYKIPKVDEDGDARSDEYIRDDIAEAMSRNPKSNWVKRAKREAAFKELGFELEDGRFVNDDGVELDEDADLSDAVDEAWGAIAGQGFYLQDALNESPTGKLLVLADNAVVEKFLEQGGYDSYSHTDTEVGGRTYIAFGPEQIKSSDPVTRDDQGNVIPLSQRFNPRKSDIRFSQKPSYGSQSDERKEDYKEALKAIPDNGRNYVQFLGSLTRTPKETQAVRPMVDFARSIMGSYQGDEIEVTAENTERVKELAAQAFQKGKAGAQFAEDISQEFQDSGFSDNGKHEGSVMAGVLQMEILDYAVRLAGEGDRSMALSLMPYANDVAASDHASISNAGRALQMRSMAGQQKGFWTVLNSLAKGERELAEKNPIYKDLRKALFSDEVKSETVAAVEKDLASAEAQKVLNPEIQPEDILEAYMPRAMGIMGVAEREITTKLFADMAELEFLLAKQEAMQAPKGAKSSIKAAREMNDPVAIQKRIDELKGNISKGLKALDEFKTSEASKETRKKHLNKTPKAKKLLSSDAEAKKLLDRLEKKETRPKKEPAPWQALYKEQITTPKTEADFIDAMLKHGVSPAIAQRLYNAAETASAELSKKARAKTAKQAKGPSQDFSAWVGGASQDGIEDFVDLVAKNLTVAGFNETGFRRALANKFAAVDQDLIDATTERVMARLEEQEAEAKDAPEPPDYDARAKKLTTAAISKKSGEDQTKLKDPMTEAIKARMKGDIDAAGLNGRLLSLGIEPETAFALGKKVQEDISDKAQEDAKRKSKALAEKLAREVAMPSKTADQLVDEMDAKQTAWLKKDSPKNKIRELAAKARKAPDVTKGPTTFPTWDEFLKQFIALGVSPNSAAILVSRLKAENALDRANRVIRKRETASNSTSFINSIVQDIFKASLEEQEDPAWRRQTMVNAFLKNGMNEPEAQKAADWLEYRFSTHLKQAQEKAAIKAAKDLNVKKPTLEKMVKAIRSRAIDPLNTDPVTKALAAEAGFGGITSEQFTELAKLDGQMRGPYQSQRAKAAARMLDIALAAKPPKGRMEILTQAWISSALSSISTISLSAVHAGFIPVRRLVTDFAGIAMDVSTGKTKPADAAQLMVNTMGNLQQAASYMYDTAKFAGLNDAYTQHIVEFINQMHSMQADMQRAVQIIKDPNATGAQKGKAAVKIAFTSTDIVRRILSTADETWGSMLQDFILRNEAMRALVQKAKMTPAAATLVFTAASNEGRIAGERHLNETGNETEAHLIERDATQNALIEAVRVAAGEAAASDVETTALLESPMELGNRRSEDAPLWDIFNTGLEWVKQLAISTRLKNELAGRMITGFVTVPANILNRSAYFTPAGIVRALYKKGKLGGDPEKIRQAYEETMKTEGQQRMRLIEGIVGTLLITILMALNADDDEEGLVVTGSGPEDRGLREAWMKKGNQPNRIQWVDKKGNVRWSVPYARGGFDHLNLPFTMVGTMDDMRLKGIKPKPANIEWGSQYMHTALKGLFDQAKFFGLKNVAAMPTQNLTDKSLASQAAYLAAPIVPWSGFTKSLGRLWTGPTDQSSVQSAIIAQLPFTNFYATPALNALGDQRGPAPTDAQWEKALMTGNFFTVGAANKGPDEDLYTMMLDRGIAPNAPLRSTVERKNGLLPDKVWQDYLKTRGGLIKKGIRRNLKTLKRLPYQDAQNLMEKISGAATKATKAKLGLE